MDDERFDGLYMNVAQQTRGIEPLLDTVFSFLRRKTDFFSGPPGSGENGTQAALEKVNEVLQKHARIYKDQQEKKKPKKKPKKTPATTLKAKTEPPSPPAPKQDDEDVIELGKDGFDVSPPSTSSKPVLQDKKEEEPTTTTETATKEDKPMTNETPAKEEKEEGGVKEGKNSSPPPPLGNGGTVDGKYVWTQTLQEVTVNIPLPENTRGRDLNVVIGKKHLKVGLKALAPDFIVNAPLTNTIIMDDSFWTVEDNKVLVIILQKLNQMEWWDSVCVGDPAIDVKTIQPENSKLDDLDGETRQTVEKMMFDQRQKALGMPTSEEQKKYDMLEKFKKAHPEMDFSQAKIS
mmetsp:Transcript_14574/g.20595  ORF Transcript_14574/g.20595 Transcript_14574/m.20595 type:complete len:347 (+) Transcript_14574:91-1131(+)